MDDISNFEPLEYYTANGVFRSQDEVIRQATLDFQTYCEPRDAPKDNGLLASQLLVYTNNHIDDENACRASQKVSTLSRLKQLIPLQIAYPISFVFHVRMISCSGIIGNTYDDYETLGIYLDCGEYAGLYVTNEYIISQIILSFVFSVTDKFIDEVITKLKLIAQRVKRTVDKDLIAVKNGIFHYDTKQIMPFSPEYVFLSKLRIDYNPFVKKVQIPNPDGTLWDVDSWIQSLSDDPDVVTLLWQVLSALIRPFVKWDKSIWLYAPSGNNGKSTLVEMMRAICGSACISIPISQFAEPFGLEGIIGKTAILVDEEDARPDPKGLRKFKSAVTNDVLQVNEKYKKIVNYRFQGITVICLNTPPDFSGEKTGAFKRRLLMILFTSCFTGAENKKIRDEYIYREDVLEYVVYKALNTDFYAFSEPDVCRKALNEYFEPNQYQFDPLIQFLALFLPQFVWDLVPFGFIYDLYTVWMRQVHPDNIIEGKNAIADKIRAYVNSHDTGWIDTRKGTAKRTSNLMDKDEHLIQQYNLSNWDEPDARKDMYHGLIRKGTAPEESQDE